MTDELDFVNNELRISCADAVELVTDYLESALGASDLADFETHLGLCEGCQVFVDQIRQTVTLSSRSRSTDVELEPAKLHDLLAALDEQAANRSG